MAGGRAALKAIARSGYDVLRQTPKPGKAATLAGLEVHDLRQEPEAVHETMICLLKTHEDRARLTREVSERLLGKVA